MPVITRTGPLKPAARRADVSPQFMSITFEANFKRRYHRVTVPLFLRVGDITYKATDWSVGGFRVDNYDGDLAPGAEFEATLLLPYKEFSVHLPVRARVARRSHNTMGCAFINLTTAQQAALHHLVEAALEGRMGDLGETLGSLNSSIPEAEKKLVQDNQTTDTEIQAMRLMPKTAMYVGLTALIALITASVVFYLLAHVRVPDGTIVGNIVQVSPDFSGRISRMAVREGQAVSVGDTLFELDNPEIRAAHAAAESHFQTALALRDSAAGQLAEERGRVSLYSEILPAQIGATEAALQSLDSKIRLAKSELDRRDQLAKESISSTAEYEQALSAFESLTADRQNTAQQLAVLRANVKSLAQGLFFDGREVHGRVKELEANLAVAEAQTGEAADGLARTTAQLSALTVKSPRTGIVYSVLHPAGENVNSPTPVIALNTTEKFFALARVMGDEAVKLKPGMPVKVVIPTLGLRLHGTVEQIGQEVGSTNLRNPAEIESAVTLVPVKVHLREAPRDLPPGIRAVMIFDVDPFQKFHSF